MAEIKLKVPGRETTAGIKKSGFATRTAQAGQGAAAISSCVSWWGHERGRDFSFHANQYNPKTSSK